MKIITTASLFMLIARFYITIPLFFFRLIVFGSHFFKYKSHVFLQNDFTEDNFESFKNCTISMYSNFF